ncbi:hypothetical protein MAQ58_22620, partial [Enterobacter sp. DRP3]|nr:hypothetical protein [Enterobacter sp. DRP3]
LFDELDLAVRWEVPQAWNGAPSALQCLALTRLIEEALTNVVKHSRAKRVGVALRQPAPGELLWDVGAGSGSIGIEWMRAHPSCQAIAIEAHAERQRFIEHNRDTLGVPGLQLVAGRAPAALAGLA